MKTCIIIGGGYSVKEGIEKGLWEKIKGQDIWSCNYAYLTMPYLPSREVFVDSAFFKSNVDRLQNLHEKGVPIYCRFNKTYDAQTNHALKHYKVTREYTGFKGDKALDGQEQILFYGRLGLCGVFALSLAIAEKYKEIYILGYDFGTQTITDKNTHFYQDSIALTGSRMEGTKIPADKIPIMSTGVKNPTVYRIKGDRIKNEVQDFETFKTNHTAKIWNVSMISNIQSLPKITYEEFFRRINESNNSGNTDTN